LSRDCRLPRCFRTTARFFKVAPMFRLELSYLRREFSFAQLMASAFLQLGDVSRLLPRLALTVSAQLAFGHPSASTVTCLTAVVLR